MWETNINKFIKSTPLRIINVTIHPRSFRKESEMELSSMRACARAYSVHHSPWRKLCLPFNTTRIPSTYAAIELYLTMIMVKGPIVPFLLVDCDKRKPKRDGERGTTLHLWLTCHNIYNINVVCVCVNLQLVFNLTKSFSSTGAVIWVDGWTALCQYEVFIDRIFNLSCLALPSASMVHSSLQFLFYLHNWINLFSSAWCIFDVPFGVVRVIAIN